MRIPEYFTDGELSCHCGCQLKPPDESVERLYALRILLHKPLQISSAARCKKQNAKCGGKPGSAHMPAKLRTGIARTWGGCGFDVLADDSLQIEIIAVALKCGFTGFGIAKTFIHIDDAARPKLTKWNYPT
jgi:zinc D-Ala-D-Ala carboxypeptidase